MDSWAYDIRKRIIFHTLIAYWHVYNIAIFSVNLRVISQILLLLWIDKETGG